MTQPLQFWPACDGLCRSPLSKLSDPQGQTVRVASPRLVQLLGALGSTPAIRPFEDTKSALALAMVDCVMTSAVSANDASWTQHSHYFYPLAFQFDFNSYAISLHKWQALQQQAELCISGAPFNGLPSRRQVTVAVSSTDVRLLKQLSRQIVLPSWLIRWPCSTNCTN